MNFRDESIEIIQSTCKYIEGYPGGLFLADIPNTSLGTSHVRLTFLDLASPETVIFRPPAVIFPVHPLWNIGDPIPRRVLQT